MSRRILLLIAAVVLLAAGVFVWFHFWASVVETFPPGALDNYLPQDTATVIAIDLKQLREKGVLDKRLGRALLDVLTKEEVGLPLALLEINPATDLDSVRLIFAPRDHGRPLVLLRARFDRTKFHTGPGQLEELKQDGFRLYRHKEGDRDLTLAPAGNTLVACIARPRVIAVLRSAASQQLPALSDVRFKELLDKVDRKQAIWLAADLARLSKPPHAGALLEAWVRPIFDRTTSVRGSASCEPHELKTTVVLECETETHAAELLQHLTVTIDTIRALGVLIRGDPEVVQIVRTFANSEASRQGKTVQLQSHLAVE